MNSNTQRLLKPGFVVPRKKRSLPSINKSEKPRSYFQASFWQEVGQKSAAMGDLHFSDFEFLKSRGWWGKELFSKCTEEILTASLVKCATSQRVENGRQFAFFELFRTEYVRVTFSPFDRSTRKKMDFAKSKQACSILGFCLRQSTPTYVRVDKWQAVKNDKACACLWIDVNITWQQTRARKHRRTLFFEVTVHLN